MSDRLKWYVVRAVSGKEKKVKQYIEAEVARTGKTERIPNVLIPMEKITQIKNGKKVVKERTLFPGYVLIEANLDTELEHAIKNINGVAGFLEDKAGVAIPLRPAEVKRILGTVDELSENENLEVSFSLGEFVKVIDGPFSSFVGEIEEISEERKKLVVKVSVFGRPTPVELNFTQVEKE